MKTIRFNWDRLQYNYGMSLLSLIVISRIEANFGFSSNRGIQMNESTE